MAAPIRALIRRLAGRPEPVPPDTGQRIQAQEQADVKRRLLRQAGDLRSLNGPALIPAVSPLMIPEQLQRAGDRDVEGLR
ncbi:hypothetical protein ACNAW0_10380 [Micromonospora sp. SL1-18]|uniref:hypothetical protein n=1 Tax=Micromonospora sp. SL1-18 TaxID=3399128 RepID=UPI003A4E328D